MTMSDNWKKVDKSFLCNRNLLVLNRHWLYFAQKRSLHSPIFPQDRLGRDDSLQSGYFIKTINQKRWLYSHKRSAKRLFHQNHKQLDKNKDF